MSFFKNLFGAKTKPIRNLSHPKDLQVGDIIKFKFLSQEDLSGKTFGISQINTYVYDNEFYPEYVLKDTSSNIIYLMVEEEDGEGYLALSKKITKSKISDILPQEQLEKILKKGIGTKVKVGSRPEGLEDWLVDSYTETDDNVKGSYIKGDARVSGSSHNAQTFKSHTLVDKSDTYALEIEVYSSNEIELSATIYHDLSEIEEMWVGND
ncbi:MAG: hypothetical protein HON23_00995 [Rickettsiales bacterium]|jgi:hypothetical protein|nr:hypothetical protein [Rickettsiales bacterium]